jgi:hypothetical protein
VVEDQLNKIIEEDLTAGLAGTTKYGLNNGIKDRALKAVPPMPNINADPLRTTKQMQEQFVKIKEGFQADLQKAEDERNVLDLRINDLNLAIRVISTSLSMLEVGE